ncbi:MAG: type II secretion system F family protein [Planctomycetota bacterium]
MTRFDFQARDRAGVMQAGVLEESSLQAAINTLRARQWLVLDIEASEPEQRRGKGLGWWFPTRMVDIEMSLRQMSVMLRSGVPLLDATRILNENAERRSLHQIWSDISEDVLEGASMAEAMQAHSQFPAVAVYLTRVGEQTGELDTTLRRSADIVRARRQLQTKIMTALAYPSAVFVAGIGVAFFMVFGVIPKIQRFLETLGKELPASTQMLVDVTTFMNENVQMLGAVSLIAILVMVAVFLWEKSRYWIDRLLLSVPVVGGVFRTSASASFSRNLQTLIQSGVSLLDGLRSVEDLIDNRRLSEQLSETREMVVEGSSLADAVRSRADFTPMLPRILAIGESSGRLDEVLGEAAEYYEEQLSAMIARLAALVEPIMLLVVGGIVGFVYISFFMALFAAAG